jgi:hypothetical protein
MYIIKVFIIILFILNTNDNVNNDEELDNSNIYTIFINKIVFSNKEIDTYDYKIIDLLIKTKINKNKNTFLLEYTKIKPTTYNYLFKIIKSIKIANPEDLINDFIKLNCVSYKIDKLKLKNKDIKLLELAKYYNLLKKEVEIKNIINYQMLSNNIIDYKESYLKEISLNIQNNIEKSDILIEISRISYNEDKTIALVYIEYYFIKNNLQPIGEYCLLKKDKDEWNIIKFFTAN